MQLNHLLNPRHNNLDVFRLLAALMVIYGHAPAFAVASGYTDIVARILHIDYSGSLAVKFFFMLSGLLVTASLMAKPLMTDFVVKRAARILPGLFVCLCATVFIVGPVFTSQSFIAYLGDSQTWHYLTHNIMLYQLEWRLPGVFDDSKYGINGSLWTLPLEVCCYLFLAAFYFVGLWRYQWLSNITLLVIVVLSFFFPEKLTPLFANNKESNLLPGCFALGALFAVNQQFIMVNLRGAVALGLLTLLLWSTPAQALLFYSFFFYSCHYVSSLRFVVERLKLPADPSYGVYIYGFVIQQVFGHLFPNRGVVFNQLVSSVAALGLGFLSWYYVEKPAMQAAKKLLAIKDAWLANPKQVGVSSLSLANLFASDSIATGAALNPTPGYVWRKQAITVAAFIAIAWLMHFIALYFIFPGYYRPLSFQHSDFYIPASFAYSLSNNTTFMGLLAWPRPLFMWYYKFSGFFGHAGSVAWVVLIVFLNCVVTAFLMRRVLGLKLDVRFAAWFALYAFILFTQPYFYTFYSQDIGSQLSYLLLAIGVAGVLALKDRHPALMFSWMMLCSSTAFLIKETYILGFGLLAFCWFILYFKESKLKALAPGGGIVIGAALSVLVSMLTKSIFVNLNARQGSDYEIHLNIVTVVKELLHYAGEGITPILLVALILIGVQLYRLQRQYFMYFLLFVGFAFAAWLPNAVLPNHHYRGYSFNGLYLCFASVFFIAKLAQDKGHLTKGLWIIVALVVLSPLSSIKAYKGSNNSWVLAQEEIQTNMLAGFTKAGRQLCTQDKAQNVLVTGITSPFHPFAFPESMRSFPCGDKAHYFFVVSPDFYKERVGQTMDLVTYMAADTDKGSLQYDQEWRFDDKGQLVAIIPKVDTQPSSAMENPPH